MLAAARIIGARLGLIKIIKTDYAKNIIVKLLIKTNPLPLLTK